MGSLGEVMMFMVTLAGAAIVGSYVLAYAASCLMLVVQDTAGGNDEIKWPKEPYADLIGRAVYFGALLAIWLAPAGMLSRGLRNTWLPDNAPLRFILIAGPGLWLWLPIGLLSSLSSVSRWTLFRPSIIWALFRLFRYTLAFYLITGVLGLLTGALWYYALFAGSKALFLPVPLVTAAVFLIYARLLGRLAWRVGRLKLPRAPKGKKRKAAAAAAKEQPQERAVAVQDPWAVPEEEQEQEQAEQEQEAEEEVPEGMSRSPYGGLIERTENYDLDQEQEPPAPAPMPLDGWQPVGMAEPEEEAGPDLAAKADRAVSQLEQRMAQKPPRPYRPRWTFFSGVWSFPFYSETQRPWLWLSFGLLVLGGMGMMLVTFFPPV
jgi:hypothetical protein